MSNEISWSYNFGITNGGFSTSWTDSLSINQNTLGAAGGIASVTTSVCDIDLGSLTSANQGYILLKNLDNSNAVDWGWDNSGTLEAIGRLLAGEVAIFRLKPSKTFAMQAITATLNVKYLILEA